jgi:TRAP-type transport system periplasmic protein
MLIRLIVLLSLGFSNVLWAQEIKVGLLAPEGTTWARKMREMADEIKKATGDKVTLRLYFGGAQGDEHDVLRKIRVGQLQGGIFTGKTLGEISGDVRVLEIPFNFNGDRAKASKALEGMTPYLNAKLSEAKFTNLGFFEIGDVYYVSQKSTPTLASLSGVKIWSWEGDRLVSAMVESLRLVSVPLPITDVLSSLSTGIIEAAYAPPMGIIAFQWNTRVNYLLDLPLSFSVGAFLVGDRTWSRISADHQKIIKEISDRYIAEINEANHKDNQEALSALRSMGIEFLKFPETDLATSKALREEMVTKLTGNLFSKEALDQLNNLLKD